MQSFVVNYENQVLTQRPDDPRPYPDGTVIVSLGPSRPAGSIDQIPQVMKDAMVSVEDKPLFIIIPASTPSA